MMKRLHGREIKKIVGDGNCLFRSLAYCQYKTQASHKRMRAAIVGHITENWNEYHRYIIGNQSYHGEVKTSEEYRKYMKGTYGTDVEILAFTEIYRTNVKIHILINDNNIQIGNNNTTNVSRQYSGPLHNGHYDVILSNEVIQQKQSNASERFKRWRIQKSTDEIEKDKEIDRCRKAISRDKQKISGAVQLKISEIKALDIGDMVIKCPYCGGLSYDKEGGRVAQNCCHNGKIKLPPLNDYTLELKKMMMKNDEFSKYKDYRQNIRSYNSAFAFATFYTKSIDMSNRGAYVYKMATYSMLLDGTPRNGQIYMYDPHEAVKYRMQAGNVDKGIIEVIENIIQNINPYASKYKTLNRKFEETKQIEMTLNFVRYQYDDIKRYNMPISGEVAALIVSKDGCIPHNIDLCVFPKKTRECQIILKNSLHVDPMTFPLLFPKGDLGWTYDMKCNDKHISTLQYYSYRLAYREDVFSPILYAGRLTQQYVIHAYIIIESNRLSYIRHNQGKLRMECYQGVVDHIEKSKANTSNPIPLGTLFILPATYIGSPRNMHQLYLDAMTIARKVGRPDLFVTMTCNPNWPEFKIALKKFPLGTTINDIPTIVCRVFQMKLRYLVKNVVSGAVFGPIAGYVYTIEFQKRGLPHCHMIFILRDDNKLMTSEAIDNCISVEIPDSEQPKNLYKAVIKHMLHGPHITGMLCWNNEESLCTKKFPKSFVNETKVKYNRSR